MRVDKSMSSDECVGHAKKIRKELGLNVLLVDEKVKQIETYELKGDFVTGDYLVVDGKVYAELEIKDGKVK